MSRWNSFHICFALLLGLISAAFVSQAVTAQTTSPRPTAQQAANSEHHPPTEEPVSPGQVEIEGRPVLLVYEPVGMLSPEERANHIAQRIIAHAKDTGASPDDVHIQERDGWTEILFENELVMVVTDGDARAAGRPRKQLAMEDVEGIRHAIREYRQQHSWRLVLRGILYATLCTLILVPALWLLERARASLRERIELKVRGVAALETRSAWQASLAYLGPITLAIGAILRWVIVLALFEIYFIIVLGFFSYTRETSHTVTRWVNSQLGTLAKSTLDYLPNLLVLAVIVLIAKYAMGLLHLLFSEIQKGQLKIRGFYPDWAEPTEKLIRMLVFVLALVVAFPYLPGAKSPAFQGISIFLGVLLSLGSSSAVANAIAGVILIYMRSFLVGDWVQIGDTTGTVTEKTLLVTRILTPKAEVITIPNSTVMSVSVKNFSVQARDGGVIFHTLISIGYDAAWRTVHELLVSAALATTHVLRQPAPFVLQSKLDDFYVAYELNAYTDAPSLMLDIYSELHQHIQDKFNEAGVEICSPHFAALRDGNTIAIPRQYVPPEYQARGFRVQQVSTEPNHGAVGSVIGDASGTG